MVEQLAKRELCGGQYLDGEVIGEARNRLQLGVVKSFTMWRR